MKAVISRSTEEAAATHENIPLALVGWSAGCAVIWSSLFATGSYLYGRYSQAVALLAVFVLSSLVLLWVVNKLWGKREEA